MNRKGPLSRWRPVKIPALAAAFFCLAAGLVAASGETREIQVIVATSASFRKSPDWKRDIFERFQLANQIFGSSFGLTFKIKDYTSWEPADETQGTDEILEEFKNYIGRRGKDEIVVGFHRMTRPFARDKAADLDVWGRATWLNGYAVIRDPYYHVEKLERNLVLVHELGHIFGAMHVPDKKDIMYASGGNIGHVKRFHPENQAVVQLTRSLEFHAEGFAVPQETLEKLVPIYERLQTLTPQDKFLEARLKWLRSRVGVEKREVPRQIAMRFPQAGFEEANRSAMKLYRENKKSEAMDAWLKALERDSASDILHANLAAAYLEGGAADKAAEHLEALLKIHPGDRAVLGRLGFAMMKKEKFSAAANYFYRAAQAKATQFEKPTPDCLLGALPEAALYFQFGKAYHRLGQPTRAVPQLQKAKALDPGNAEIHLILSKALVNRGAYADAVKAIGDGQKQNGADPYLYVLLFDSYRALRRNQDALRAAQQGLKKVTDQQVKAVLYRKMAEIHARSPKQVNQAMDELNSALQLNPHDPETHLQVGLIYAEYGYPRDARNFYQNALRIDPNHKRTQRALASLKRK